MPVLQASLLAILSQWAGGQTLPVKTGTVPACGREALHVCCVLCVFSLQRCSLLLFFLCCYGPSLFPAFCTPPPPPPPYTHTHTHTHTHAFMHTHIHTHRHCSLSFITVCRWASPTLLLSASLIYLCKAHRVWAQGSNLAESYQGLLRLAL